MPRLGLGQSLTGGAVTSEAIPHSLEFDGTDDFVDLGDLTILPDGQRYGTVSCWAYNRDNSVTASMVSKYKAASPIAKEWFFLWDSNSKALFAAWATGYSASSGLLHATGSETLLEDTWYHIAGTFHPTEKNKVYINGVLRATSTNAMAADGLDDTTAKIYIGRNSDASYFDGFIKDVAIWDVTLTVDDLLSIYNDGTPNDLTKAASYTDGSGVDRSGDLVGYWRMNEGTGVTLKDSSVSGNNGTIDGAVYSTEVPPND